LVCPIKELSHKCDFGHVEDLWVVLIENLKDDLFVITLLRKSVNIIVFSTPKFRKKVHPTTMKEFLKLKNPEKKKSEILIDADLSELREISIESLDLNVVSIPERTFASTRKCRFAVHFPVSKKLSMNFVTFHSFKNIFARENTLSTKSTKKFNWTLFSP
jgi:hypothetical protein